MKENMNYEMATNMYCPFCGNKKNFHENTCENETCKNKHIEQEKKLRETNEENSRKYQLFKKVKLFKGVKK